MPNLDDSGAPDAEALVHELVKLGPSVNSHDIGKVNAELMSKSIAASRDAAKAASETAKWTRRLAWATFGLAVATFVLVLVTVFR